MYEAIMIVSEYRSRPCSSKMEDMVAPTAATVMGGTTGKSLPATLGQWPAKEVGYHCRRCPRGERFDLASMLATYGDVPINQVLEAMAKGCPRWDNDQLYELCGAIFVWPWERDEEGR